VSERTHDYTGGNRRWGHDYTFRPVNSGAAGEAMGWGRGIVRGDYLILENGTGSTRYRVVEIEYFMNPDDMWRASVPHHPHNQERRGSDGSTT
jgi:hypothetical protein